MKLTTIIVFVIFGAIVLTVVFGFHKSGGSTSTTTQIAEKHHLGI